MPVMLPSWVERCWEEGLRKVVRATEPEMVTPLHSMSLMTFVFESLLLFQLLTFLAEVASLSTLLWLHNLSDWP